MADKFQIVIDSVTGEIFGFGFAEFENQIKTGQEVVKLPINVGLIEGQKMIDEKGRRRYRYDRSLGELVELEEKDRVAKRDEAKEQWEKIKIIGTEKNKLDFIAQIIGLEELKL